MGFSEALSDDGSQTGHGSGLARGLPQTPPRARDENDALLWPGVTPFSARSSHLLRWQSGRHEHAPTPPVSSECATRRSASGVHRTLLPAHLNAPPRSGSAQTGRSAARMILAGVTPGPGARREREKHARPLSERSGASADLMGRVSAFVLERCGTRERATIRSDADFGSGAGSADSRPAVARRLAVTWTWDP
jgi:hypothetical protein